MEIYDTTRGVSFDTRPILMFAKIQVEGLGTGLDRDDWMVAIEQRCEERYGAIDKLSPEQRFTKTITEDNIGKQLYAAMKAAPPPSPAEPPARVTTEQFAKMDAEIRGPAHAAMHVLATDSQRARGARVYSHPDNQRLRELVKYEHMAATMRGNTVYQAEQDRSYSNPNPPLVRTSPVTR